MKPLSYLFEYYPEAFLGCGRQIQHVGDVLVRYNQEMKGSSLVRKLIGSYCPALGLPEYPLSRLPTKTVGAEQAYTGRFQPLHLSKLLSAPRVLHAVKAHSTFRV
jgi:hypothetical protein